MNVLTIPQGGTLEIAYAQQGIDRMTLREGNNLTEFALKCIWINDQPAHFLEEIRALQLEQSSLNRLEVIRGELCLFLTLKTEISLNIQYQEKTATFKVSPFLTILGLKKHLQRKGYCSEDNFQIYDENEEFLDDALQLMQCGIKDKATLVIEVASKTIVEEDFGVAGFYECSLEPIRFVSFKEIVQLNFSDKAPAWRRIVKGLNLVGVCPNDSCPAYNQKACVQLGMGIFDNIDELCQESKCPCCRKNLMQVSNCIFWDCLYSIHGKNAKGEKKNLVDVAAPHNKGLSFAEASEDGPRGQIIKWKNLILSTKPKKNSFCVML